MLNPPSNPNCSRCGKELLNFEEFLSKIIQGLLISKIQGSTQVNSQSSQTSLIQGLFEKYLPQIKAEIISDLSKKIDAHSSQDLFEKYLPQIKAEIITGLSEKIDAQSTKIVKLNEKMSSKLETFEKLQTLDPKKTTTSTIIQEKKEKINNTNSFLDLSKIIGDFETNQLKEFDEKFKHLEYALKLIDDKITLSPLESALEWKILDAEILFQKGEYNESGILFGELSEKYKGLYKIDKIEQCLLKAIESFNKLNQLKREEKRYRETCSIIFQSSKVKSDRILLKEGEKSELIEEMNQDIKKTGSYLQGNVHYDIYIAIKDNFSQIYDLIKKIIADATRYLKLMDTIFQDPKILDHLRTNKFDISLIYDDRDKKLTLFGILLRDIIQKGIGKKIYDYFIPKFWQTKFEESIFNQEIYYNIAIRFNQLIFDYFWNNIGIEVDNRYNDFQNLLREHYINEFIFQRLEPELFQLFLIDQILNIDYDKMLPEVSKYAEDYKNSFEMIFSNINYAVYFNQKGLFRLKRLIRICEHIESSTSDIFLNEMITDFLIKYHKFISNIEKYLNKIKLEILKERHSERENFDGMLAKLQYTPTRIKSIWDNSEILKSLNSLIEKFNSEQITTLPRIELLGDDKTWREIITKYSVHCAGENCNWTREFELKKPRKWVVWTKKVANISGGAIPFLGNIFENFIKLFQENPSKDPIRISNMCTLPTLFEDLINRFEELKGAAQSKNVVLSNIFPAIREWFFRQLLEKKLILNESSKDDSLWYKNKKWICYNHFREL